MTTADKRRITRDWAKAFPALGVWKPLRLLRRLGPVVQGIVLEQSSGGDDYLPTAHVHALTRPFPTIAMTLAAPLRSPRGTQERISLRRHDERHEEAAHRLRQQSPLDLDRPIVLDELLAAYCDEILRQQGQSQAAAVNEIEDLVLVPAAVGRDDQVEAGLDLAQSVHAGWAPGALDRWSRSDRWLDELAAGAKDRTTLEATVEAEIRTHKLAALPVSTLI